MVDCCMLIVCFQKTARLDCHCTLTNMAFLERIKGGSVGDVGRLCWCVCDGWKAVFTRLVSMARRRQIDAAEASCGASTAPRSELMYNGSAEAVACTTAWRRLSLVQRLGGGIDVIVAPGQWIKGQWIKNNAFHRCFAAKAGLPAFHSNSLLWLVGHDILVHRLGSGEDRIAVAIVLSYAQNNAFRRCFAAKAGLCAFHLNSNSLLWLVGHDIHWLGPGRTELPL
jgi:hypothetical protein